MIYLLAAAILLPPLLSAVGLLYMLWKVVLMFLYRPRLPESEPVTSLVCEGWEETLYYTPPVVTVEVLERPTDLEDHVHNLIVSILESGASEEETVEYLTTSFRKSHSQSEEWVRWTVQELGN